MNGIVTGHGPIACHAGAGLRGGMKRVLRQVHRLGSALRFRAVTSFNGAATGLPSSAGTTQGLSRQRVNKAPPPASGRWRRKIATVLRELRAILNLARWRMPARHVRIIVLSQLSNADINRRVTNETAKDRVRRGSSRPPRIVACFSFDQSSGFRPTCRFSQHLPAVRHTSSDRDLDAWAEARHNHHLDQPSPSLLRTWERSCIGIRDRRRPPRVLLVRHKNGVNETRMAGLDTSGGDVEAAPRSSASSERRH
jgi:hypothetical protein